VRLHRIDENVCSEVAPLLAYLRDLAASRSPSSSCITHARGPAACAQGRRSAGRGNSMPTRPFTSVAPMTSSPSPSSIARSRRTAHFPVQLVADGAALALTLTTETAAPSAAPADPELAATPAQRIVAALADLDGAVTLDQIRRACRMRTQTLCDALAELVRTGCVLKSEAGYRLA
jgi:hypothetical protein